MAKPRLSALAAPPKLGSYSVGKPRFVCVCVVFQPWTNLVNAFVDNDWAGELSTTKSTPGA